MPLDNDNLLRTMQVKTQSVMADIEFGGGSQYSLVASGVPCHVEKRSSHVIDREGRQTRVDATIFTNPPIGWTLGPGDCIIVGSQNFIVLEVDELDSNEGPDHLQIQVKKSQAVT